MKSYFEIQLTSLMDLMAFYAFSVCRPFASSFALSRGDGDTELLHALQWSRQRLGELKA